MARKFFVGEEGRGVGLAVARLLDLSSPRTLAPPITRWQLEVRELAVVSQHYHATLSAGSDRRPVCTASMPVVQSQWGAIQPPVVACRPPPH